MLTHQWWKLVCFFTYLFCHPMLRSPRKQSSILVSVEERRQGIRRFETFWWESATLHRHLWLQVSVYHNRNKSNVWLYYLSSRRWGGFSCPGSDNSSAGAGERSQKINGSSLMWLCLELRYTFSCFSVFEEKPALVSVGSLCLNTFLSDPFLSCVIKDGLGAYADTSSEKSYNQPRK